MFNSWKNSQIFENNSLDNIVEEAQDKCQDNLQLINLIQGCGDNLADILMGKKNPLEVIFSGGSFANTTELYRDSLVASYYNGIASEMMQKLVDFLPSNTYLRMLEVGAGTAGTTSWLLPVLPPERTSYYFTDVSSLFLDRAENQFSQYSFVNYGLLDIEKNPQAQGYDKNSFDVIIAANVLHATQNLSETLEHIRSLLAPGGLLIVWEITKPHLWFDLTFGLVLQPLDKSDSLRQGQPFLTAEKWQQTLDSFGFTQVNCLPEIDSDAASLGQHLIMAQAFLEAENSMTSAFKMLIPEAPNLKDQIMPIKRDNQFIHPLLGDSLDLPIKETIFQSNISCKSPVFIQDHQVYEQPVLPGTAYIEMAIAAAKKVLGTEEVLIENIIIRQALIFSEIDTYKIQLILTPEDGQKYSWQILSQDANQQQNKRDWLLHATGKIQSTIAKQETISPKSLQNQFANQMSAIEHYANYQDRNIQYGTCFQGVQKVWWDDNQALGLIQLPEKLRSQWQDYQIHPALLDACLQILGASIATQQTANTAYMPIGLDSFQFYRRPSLQVWSYGTLRPVHNSNQETFSADLRLFDETGQLIAEIAGLHLKRARPQALLNHHRHLQNLLYEVEWQSKEFEKQSQVATKQGIWLIFAEGDGLGVKLAQQLTKQGRSVLTVFPGAAYEFCCQEGYYKVNPHQPKDIQQLLTEVINAESIEYKLVFLWSLESNSLSATTPDSLEVPTLETLQNFSCGSLLYLIQGLLNSQYSQRTRLWLVTRYTQPVGLQSQAHPINVTKSPIWGLGRVLALEYPNLWGGIIDLDDTSITTDEVSRILAEIENAGAEDQIAFRQQQRYVPRLIPSKLVPRKSFEVKTDGIYLITGGLGVLGLQIARWLVEQGVQHLCLIGRSHLPQNIAESNLASDHKISQKIASILELESLGATVQVIKADVSDLGQMTSVFEQFKNTELPIRGIIHGAGVSQLQNLKDIDLNSWSDVLRPKVQGAWILHQLTQHIQLDFFVLLSSAASIWGSQGLGHYAAANHFLDALAHHRQALGLKALSINWARLSERGMVSPEEEQSMERIGLKAIPIEKALSTLGFLIAAGVTQKTVASVNWSRFKPTYESRKRRPFLQEVTISSPKTKSQSNSQILDQLTEISADEGQKLLIAHLQGEVAKLMGFAASHQLDPQQNLVEIGMDSLMTVDFKSRLENSLGLSFPSNIAFEYPTIKALTNYLLGKLLKTHSDSNLDISLPKIKPINRDLACFPLSYFQESYWFLEQLAHDNQYYNANAPLLLSLEGFLDVEILRKTLSEIVKRHEILRTTFSIVDSKPVMEINSPENITLNLSDLTNIPNQQQSKELARIKELELNQKFDLVDKALFRVKLIKLDDQKYLLICTMHHLVGDVWSFGLLAKEITTIYTAFAQGKLSPLKNLPVQYADFAQWQQDMMRDNSFTADIDYWQHKLANAEPKLDLPIEKKPTSFLTFSYLNQSIILDSRLVQAVKEISNAHGVTVFTTLVTVLKILLFKWTKQEDIVIGTVSANRGQKEIADLIGCFVNFLPLRSQVLESKLGLVLLKEVQATVLEAYNHQALPFIKIVENAKANTKNLQNPIYNVAFLLHNFRFAKTFNMGNNLIASLIPTDPQATPLDLRFVAIPDEDLGTIKLECEYNPDLFKESTIKNLLTAYNQILQEFVINPQKRLKEFTILDKLIINDQRSDTIDSDAEFTKIISQMVDIFSDVLSIEKFNLDDNIFALGGDLSEVNKILDQIKEIFAIELNVAGLNQNLTVAGLAKIIEEELEKQAQILAMLEQLSDEEVEKLLQEDSNIRF
ncbi:MAG: SDR family NAD(P)-dependent oxidoreductase [Cyanobacteria bacterium P01_F01_bin.143]